MINENVAVSNAVDEEELGIDVRLILTKFVIYWKWFLVSIVLCAVGAFLYLRYVSPVYKVQASVMINDEKKGSFQNPLMAMADFGLMPGSGGVDNEIEILSSRSMIKQAIMDLGLYVNYEIRKGLSHRTLYGKYPINAYIAEEDLEQLTKSFTIKVSQPDSSSYIIEYKYRNPETKEEETYKKTIASLPYALETPIGNVFLSKGEMKPLPPKVKLYITIVPPVKMARACRKDVMVEPTSRTTSVVYISYWDVNRRRGVAFVNALIAAYNRQNNNDKNMVAMRTEEFIRERLAIVEKELDETEQEMARYKQNSGLTDLVGDARIMLEENSLYEKKNLEITTQLKLITYLREYVNNPENVLQAIPANVGLADAPLSALIAEYNKGVVERNRLLRTAAESNPAVMDVTTSVGLMAEAIRTSVETLYNSLTIQKTSFDKQTAKYNTKISNAPGQEKILAAYMRQQELKSGLYLMLLQKREENSIALAVTVDNAKIVDAAYANERPTSPRPPVVCFVALLLGCMIPMGLIYLSELLRFKIEGRNDLEKLTKVPVLGDVAVSHDLKKGQRGIVIRENQNDMMAEIFRSIRTNLQFMLGGSLEGKVIQFTSTTSGEGKTFVSSNLAMSLALLGKKVILLGLDIRRPRLAEMFGFSNRTSGITSFLAGDPNDKELLFSQIINSGINDNLDILPAGIVPPNPAELLTRVNLDNAIKFLAEKYDYVILDTAPVGLVTDTLIIARVADATVYVCRADYTPKNDILSLNTLYEEKKFNNLSLVLNGVDLTKRKYGYYYGAGNYGRYGGYSNAMRGSYADSGSNKKK